jgi:hypothetical protein
MRPYCISTRKARPQRLSGTLRKSGVRFRRGRQGCQCRGRRIESTTRRVCNKIPGEFVSSPGVCFPQIIRPGGDELQLTNSGLNSVRPRGQRPLGNREYVQDPCETCSTHARQTPHASEPARGARPKRTGEPCRSAAMKNGPLPDARREIDRRPQGKAKRLEARELHRGCAGGSATWKAFSNSRPSGRRQARRATWPIVLHHRETGEQSGCT